MRIYSKLEAEQGLMVVVMSRGYEPSGQVPLGPRREERKRGADEQPGEPVPTSSHSPRYSKPGWNTWTQSSLLETWQGDLEEIDDKDGKSEHCPWGPQGTNVFLKANSVAHSHPLAQDKGIPISSFIYHSIWLIICRVHLYFCLQSIFHIRHAI